jgi:hypothetical protein
MRNASGWYQAAGRSIPTLSLEDEEERDSLAAEMLAWRQAKTGR